MSRPEHDKDKDKSKEANTDDTDKRKSFDIQSSIRRRSSSIKSKRKGRRRSQRHSQYIRRRSSQRGRLSTGVPRISQNVTKITYGLEENINPTSGRQGKYKYHRSSRPSAISESPANHDLREAAGKDKASFSSYGQKGHSRNQSIVSSQQRSSMLKVAYNIQQTTSFFTASLLEVADIDLHYYILGYEELYIICESLGPVFRVVGSHMRSRLDRLIELRKRDFNKYYYSMMSMVAYEVGTQLIKKPGFVSGCKTFLVLNRGLDFLVKFLQKVYTLEDNEETNMVANEVYNDTFGIYHSWLVKKSVHVLFSVGLPTKVRLVKKLCGGDEEVLYRDIPLMLDVTNEIVSRADDHFDANNLLHL